MQIVRATLFCGFRMDLVFIPLSAISSTINTNTHLFSTLDIIQEYKSRNNNSYSPHNRVKLNNLWIAYCAALFISGCGVTYKRTCSTNAKSRWITDMISKVMGLWSFVSPDAIHFLVWDTPCCMCQEAELDNNFAKGARPVFLSRLVTCICTNLWVLDK